jgi:hypothetical protein
MERTRIKMTGQFDEMLKDISEIKKCMKMFRDAFTDEDWKKMLEQAELDVQ